MKKIFIKIIYTFFIVIILTIFYLSLKTPSLARDWNLDQKILPEINFSGNIVSIKNVRNFTYHTTEKYDVNYYDREYNLDEIESLYYIIEPFSNFDGPAHTMISFGFNNGDYLTISAEIRKKKGDSFSAFKGLFRSYEIVYMIGDEKDLVKLRSNYRKDEVIMYPIKTSNENIKSIFVSMLERADKLSSKPEFYNTLTNNCTTSIFKHVNDLREVSNKNKIGWSIYTFLPSRSDKVIYNLGYIDTNLSLEEARKYYKINELSEKYADNEDYSKMIRKDRK